MRPAEERAVESARRALVEAQYCLLCPTVEGIAGAVLNTAIGLLQLANADPTRRSLDIVVAALHEAQAHGGMR